MSSLWYRQWRERYRKRNGIYLETRIWVEKGRSASISIATISVLRVTFLGNFKRVSQLASSSPIITPSLDLTNECVSRLVDTHPSLVLQWCQVLRNLKYMDAQFWCGLIDTGTRLSTGGNQHSLAKSSCLLCINHKTSIWVIRSVLYLTEKALLICPRLLLRRTAFSSLSDSWGERERGNENLRGWCCFFLPSSQFVSPVPDNSESLKQAKNNLHNHQHYI